jgi:hypothetical protein
MGGIRDYATDDLERELRMEQMRADIKLKQVQAAAEWPKVFTAILVAFGAVVGLVAGVFGYTLGSHH